MQHDSTILHRPTVADVVAEHLALDRAELIDRVADLEAERASYRDLAQQAVHALAALTRERDRLRADRLVTLNENRDLRARIKAADAELVTLRADLRQCRQGRAA